MMRRLASHLHARLLPPSREPDFLIGPRGDPYMRRWWLIPRNRVFNIYLHHIRHDDDDRALHDHPWPSLSLMLKGCLAEIYMDRRSNRRVRMIPEGAIVWRPASFAHRLVLTETGCGAWTTFVTGPRIREWGFHCPKGWRRWQDFVAKDDHGSIGRGCGEDT